MVTGSADADVVHGTVEGIILARYSWDALRAEAASTQVTAITIVATGDTDALAAGARCGHLKALATCVSRDLANSPPAHLTAVRWAAIAERVAADHSLGVESHDRDWLLAERCGGIIAVNGGGDEQPRLITLTYDSGGLAIRPGDVERRRVECR